ncbi:GLUG motif-containing protein [Parabacteroides sp.]
MKKHEHSTTYRLLLLIFLCSLSKVILADDATTQTWEDLAQAPNDWSTSSTEINITSAEELAWVAKMVNEDSETGSDGKKGFEGVTITLTQNLNLEGHLWIPIGEKGSDTRSIRPFKGSFEGNNNTISNMTIISDGSAGLFGQINNTTIKDIKLTNCLIKKSSDNLTTNKNIYAGGIAGASISSTIKCCHVQGTISYEGEAAVYVGGITGKNGSENNTQAIIEDCSFEGKFDYNLELTALGGIKSGSVGGIAGTNDNSNGAGSIIKCHAKIDAKVTQGKVGGITTSNRGVIKSCNTEGNISVTFLGSLAGIGGIVSDNSSPFNSNPMPTYTIESCTSSCNIYLVYKVNQALTSESYYAKVGGIAGSHGQNTPPITDCTTSGTISVELATEQAQGTDLKNNICIAGGIVGYSKASIQNCETSAQVSAITNIPATEAYAGGIVGIFMSAPIKNCVALGTITSEGATCYAGGIAGQCSNTIKNSFSTANIISNGNNNSVGGIAGYNTHNIQDCYSIGNITSTGTTNNIGGIAGVNKNVVLNCYATGRLEAIITASKAETGENTTSYVGGIVGENSASVKNCLSLNIAGIINENGKTGRIIGNQDDQDASVTASGNVAHPEIPGSWANGESMDGKDWENKQTYPFSPSDAWDFSDNTKLPKLKKINDDGNYADDMVANQPEIPLLSLQSFTITFDTPDNGTLTVTAQDGSSITTGNKVLGNTQLTIKAEPSDNTYKLDELLVNNVSFTSGDKLTVSEDITIFATFSKSEPDPEPEPGPEPEPTPEPEPAPVYYLVTLPGIEGVTTDPVAGDYEIEAWDSFRFYLTIDAAYSQSEPIVTTDRGETIEPRSSDGAYIINFVRSDIQISIDGIVKNPDPVANETIETNDTKVWAEGACLHLHTAKRESILIYSYNGTLLNSFTLLGDQTVYYPQGNYIVVAGGKRFKVQVK